MRIITGKYRGRRFEVPHSFKARPTTDCAKENIFNVLNGYVDYGACECLDLFAGTGSISLEMLSRGARMVTSVEIDGDHVRFIRQCIDKLNDKNCILIKGDVFRFIKSCKQQFGLIFADPPYSLPNLAEIPDLLFRRGVVSKDGVLVLEHGKTNDFSRHPYFLERRVYGSVNFSIFRQETAAEYP